MDDELDIYDDLDDFQEAQNKISKELQDWQTKCETAQKEIDNLKAENKAIGKKIKTMEVNFQNLLDTAKAEIKRKDAQILQLRKEKDDICFRRKRPTKFAPKKTQPLNEDQPQEQKHWTREETTELITEKACDNNNKNWIGEIKQNEIEHKTDASPEIKPVEIELKTDAYHDKKKHEKRGNPFSSETLRQHSTHVKDRDKDKGRDHSRRLSRSRECDQNRAKSSSDSHTSKSKELKRSRRSRSRSCSPSDSREWDRAKSSSHRHTSKSKELKRRRSRSRSNSHSRSRHHNKSSTRHHSRETNRKPHTKTTKNEQIVDNLFGSTPNRNSPLDKQGSSTGSDKVLQRMLANIEPATPLKLYTPPSQIKNDCATTSKEAARNSQQTTAEDINSYFLLNVEPIKQQNEDIIKDDVQDKVDIKPNEQISNLEYIVNYVVDAKTHELIPGINFTRSEESTNNANTIEIAEEAIKSVDIEIREHIPGLDLISDDESITDVEADEVTIRDLHTVEEIIREVDDANTNERTSGLLLNVEEDVFDAVDERIHGLVSNVEEEVVDKADDAETNEQVPGLDLFDKDKAISEVDAATNEQIPGLDFNEFIPGLREVANEVYDTNIIEQTPDLDEIMKEVIQHHEGRELITEEALVNEQANVEDVEIIAVYLDGPENELFELAAETEDNNTEDTSNKTDSSDNKPAQFSKHESPIEQAQNEAEQLMESIDAYKHNAAISDTQLSPMPPSKSKSCRTKSQANENDNMARATRSKRATKSIQIIEDIRLPVLMDIEHIAVKVDEPKSTVAEPNEDSNRAQLDLQSCTVSPNELSSESVKFTSTPKQNVNSAFVTYVQPDSTKLDYNVDDALLEAAMNELIKKTPEYNKSYPNLSLETDTIELALEQLHEHSHGKEQPDETTVTSTSMKGAQMPKQDLIKILTQSPMQQPASEKKTPPNLSVRVKKLGARTVSEMITSNSAKGGSITPERGDRTPLKKRKIELTEEPAAEPIVPQTPPHEVAIATEISPPPQVTIDETFNASSLDLSSDTSIVTKRCSLGNSDYQFETINDEVILHVTRRRRRRPAAAAVTAAAPSSDQQT